MTAAPHDEPTLQPPHRSGGTRWITPPGVLLKRWPDSDDGVIYDARHARTHLLAAAACEVLLQCQQAPSSLAMLADLATRDEPELIRATVTALEVAGLLSRQAQPAPVAP